MMTWLHKLGLSEVASAHGPEIDRMMGAVHWLMLGLFIGWIVFFIYALLRFRSSRNPVANYHGATGRASNYVEVTVVIAEAFLLLGFSIPVWSRQMSNFPKSGEALEVYVTAEQFAWNNHYAGADGKFGQTDPKFVDAAANPVGIDPADPNGKDDIINMNQLHLPVDKPVIVHLKSKDVIHGFGIAQMRVKHDAIPGMTIPIWFTPTVTTQQMRQRLNQSDFDYQIACAQLCGIGHSGMKGYVTVETAEEFDAWLLSQAPVPSAEGEETDSFWQ